MVWCGGLHVGLHRIETGPTTCFHHDALVDVVLIEHLVNPVPAEVVRENAQEVIVPDLLEV